MNKRLLSVALVMTVGTTLLVGSSSLAAKKKLRWWAPGDATWKQMHDKFEKENPNVDVELINGDIDKFYTMITAGMMPDVWGPWSTPGIHADVNRNWAVDLGPYTKRDGKAMNIDDFFPGLMREFKVAGKQYSLPTFSYADYYFYNKDLYAQAGLVPPPVDSKDKSWNWDKMVLNAQKMTKIDQTTGKFLQSGVDFTHGGLFDWPNYFHMWGAKPYSKNTLATSIPQEVDFNTPEMVQCLTKMWELMYKQRVTNPGGGNFNGGKCGATIEYGYGIQDKMKVKKLNWAIAPLPWAVTNSGTLWPDGWRISRVAKDKELAWKFIKFLCAPENMKIIIGDPKSAHPGTPVARMSVFKETLGRDVGRATGMAPEDVFKVHEEADDVAVVKYQETVCLHADIVKYIDPVIAQLWTNKVGPKECAVNLQNAADKALPVLFKRWLRNVKFTGADKK